MKKMFTTANRGLLWVEAEGAIYSVFDQTEKRRTFFDGEGVVLENYSRPHIQETDSVEIIPTDVWPFSQNWFDEEKAEASKDLPNIIKFRMSRVTSYRYNL